MPDDEYALLIVSAPAPGELPPAEEERQLCDMLALLLRLSGVTEAELSFLDGAQYDGSRCVPLRRLLEQVLEALDHDEH
jgi:hypothetical protein